MRALIDGLEIDLPTDQVPAFTFALEDSNDVAVVRGTESGEITIPATNTNKSVIGGYAIGEVSPRVRDYKQFDGTATLFDGKAFIRTRSDREITFTAVSGNAQWITALKDRNMRDLSMGETERIDRAYVLNTWTDPTTQLYFPLVDYGTLELRASSYNVPFPKVRPAVRVAQFLIRAFADAGFGLVAGGRFAALWPKLVLLNTNDAIPISESFKQRSKASFTGSGQSIVPGTAELQFQTVVSDPSSTYTGTGRYTAPFTMLVNAHLKFTFTVQNLQSPGFGSIVVRFKNFTTNTVYEANVHAVFIGQTVITDDFTTDDQGIAVGDQIGFEVAYGLFFDPGNDAFTKVNSVEVTFNCTAIPWQEGLSLDIAKQAPDISLSDLMKWVCNVFNLIPRTHGNTVTLMYYDDFFRPISEGFTDLTERIDGDVIKVTNELPAAYLFKMAEDSNDRLITNLRQSAGIYGSGDHRYNVNGEVEDDVIEIGFAATAMGTILGGLRVPCIRDKEGEVLVAPDPDATFYPDKYDWNPRLCIADGVSSGSWTFDSIGESSYPNCYSYAQSLGGAYSTMFGDVSGSVGNVNRNWLTRLKRRISPMVQCNVFWWDHELMSFDPSKPVKIHDGQMPVFCYTTEISQHQFTVGDSSETLLTPL